MDSVTRRTRRRSSAVALLAALTLVVAGCGDSAASGGSDASSEGEQLSIMATTSILGDVTTQVVGDAAEVTTLMPPGSDPHSFEPSAQQVAQMQEADLVVANGAGLEQQVENALSETEGAGVAVFYATDQIETLEFAGHGEHGEEGHGDEDGHSHDEHGDDGHSDEKHSESEHSHDEHGDEGHSDEGEHSDEARSEEGHADDEHGHGSQDPHFWMDPTRMSTVVDALAAEIGELSGDADAVAERAAQYAAQLDEVDTETQDMLGSIPDDQRKLVTNHEAFGYFADHYDFEMVGTVIPDTTTGAEPSAQDLEELAETIEQEQVRAIFAENTSSDRLAETLATEVGANVEVVELYSGSLGEEGSDAATYVDMLRTNATRISDALSG